MILYVVCVAGERTKEKKGGKSGTGGDDVYIVKWRYYNSLKFMFPPTLPGSVTDSMAVSTAPFN